MLQRVQGLHFCPNTKYYSIIWLCHISFILLSADRHLGCFGALLCLIAQSCLILCNPMDSSPPGSSVHGDSPGKHIGVGCHALLQGSFPTNPGLSPCRWILYCLSHQGKRRILEWVASPFSRGSSWPRNQTGVCCIAGRFFTSWANKKPLGCFYLLAIMNNIAVNICAQVFLWTCFNFSWVYA